MLDFLKIRTRVSVQSIKSIFNVNFKTFRLNITQSLIDVKFYGHDVHDTNFPSNGDFFN